MKNNLFFIIILSIFFNLYVAVINSAQLLYYVKKGDFAKVRELIDKNKSIWVSDDRGRNVLQVAARECHFNMVKYIIEKKWNELRVHDIERAIKEAKIARGQLSKTRKKLILQVADLMREPAILKKRGMTNLDEKADVKNAELQSCRRKLRDCEAMILYLKWVRKKKIQE